MTIRPGLCSVTLRQQSIGEVVATCVRAGIEGIEWGGDVHVPPKDLDAGREARARCRDAGIEVVSYGSYFGMHDTEPVASERATERVLDAAEGLGAPMVRIWTELGVVPDAAPPDRARVRGRTAAFAAAAARRDLVVALELHPGCVTETAASTMALLDDIDAPNLRTHWQPDPALTATEALVELVAVRPRLAHLHTFSWGPGGFTDRRPLIAGDALWGPALQAAAEAPPLPGDQSRYALCEFVPDDDPDQLVADVATLRRWLAEMPPTP